MRVLATVLFVLLLGLPSAAQDPSAAHLSRDVRVLYAHNGSEGTEASWMNSLADDGDQAAPGYGAPFGTGEAQWVMTLAPGISRTVTLDPAGMINVTAYVGGSTHAGSVDVSTEITYGEQTVATGEAKELVFTPSQATGGVYAAVTWSLPPAVTELAPGTDLVWTVTAVGEATAIFMGMGEGRGRSNIELPVLMAAPPPATGPRVVEGTMEGDPPTYNVAFDDTTTEEHRIAGPDGLADGVLRVDATVNAGSVALQVVDAGGAILFEQPIENGTHQFDGAGAAAGEWVAIVTFDAYAGAFGLTLEERTEVSNGTMTEEPEETSASTQESPALGLVLMGTLVLALAAIRRRR